MSIVVERDNPEPDSAVALVPPVTDWNSAIPSRFGTIAGRELVAVRERTTSGRDASRCNGFTGPFFSSSASRYTKMVVDSNLMAQKYNPEFTVTTASPPTTSYGNTNTSVLIDQLRHINQVSPPTVICRSA